MMTILICVNTVVQKNLLIAHGKKGVMGETKKKTNFVLKNFQELSKAEQEITQADHRGQRINEPNNGKR